MDTIQALAGENCLKLLPVPLHILPQAWAYAGRHMNEVPGADSPQAVYAALESQKATLYLILERGEIQGFLVLRVEQRLFDKALHIWILFNESPHDVMGIFSDELDAIARESDCARLTFTTVRRGFEKIAPRYGFAFESVTYSRGL